MAIEVLYDGRSAILVITIGRHMQKPVSPTQQRSKPTDWTCGTGSPELPERLSAQAEALGAFIAQLDQW